MKRQFAIIVLILGMISVGSLVRAEEDLFKEIIKKDPQFSAEEIKKLESKQVIYHANASGLPGGEATLYANLTPSEAFKTASDFEHYVEFIPKTISLKVIKRDEKSALLDGEYKSTWPYSKIAIQSINEFDLKDPNKPRLVWKATKSNMKYAVGYWVFTPHGTGTLVTYGMEFDLDWIPHFVAKKNGKERVIEMVQAVKARGENTKTPGSSVAAH